MPKITRFDISNFKGIESTSISLSERVDTPIITLIGLNESGKTTILEALSNFVSSNSLVSSLFNVSSSKNGYSDIIPINKRAAFSEDVIISANVELDVKDISGITAIAAQRNLIIDTKKLEIPFTVASSITFEDSIFKEDSSVWDIQIWSRPISDSESKEFTACDDNNNEPEFWQEVVQFVKKNLPSIAYFPTFLVDIPNRIYLQEHKNETPVNQHYRSIFQSIMEGIEGGLDLEKHVYGRIESFANGQNNSNNASDGWLIKFMDSPQKHLINSVFQKVSNSVTKEVIGGWNRVFTKETRAKQISVDWGIDSGKNNLPYASFMVSDGESKYDISERSLGFRWFFSFLLFTAFKGESNKPTILIFDEPAANLHAKAQAELLKSFEKIATKGSKIIYSTHSHHMINPKWLGGAYIVENTALNQEGASGLDFETSPTNIKATKYKEFLSSYPTRSSYFQPVIESLEYIVPEVIGSAPFVLVEGVSDYYALSLAQKISKLELKYRILPGVGSGASGPMISLMMGRAEQFVILLDDDQAGRKECERYKNNWYLSPSTVFTIAEINESLAGHALEGMLDNTTIDIIKKHYDTAGPVTKKQIGWYLSEACSAMSAGQTYLSKETVENLVAVLKFLNLKIGALV